jgi:uncharacterized protein
MKPTQISAPADERRLNLFEFAQARRELAGSYALREMPRLLQALSGDTAALGDVRWRLRGSLRELPGGGLQPCAELAVRAALPMQCQRCLQTALQDIDEQVVFRLVDAEPEITLEELEADDEALDARAPIDLHELVEDQLILALPLVPMHETCPRPLDAGEPVRIERESPFAVLERLRKPQRTD